MGQIVQCGAPVNLSASGAFSLTRGALIGFYVNSTSSGTIIIKDGGTNGIALSGTITPAIGWHTFPAAITSSSGGYATIGGTLNVTLFFAI